MLFASKLGWGGLTSCALGGLLALIGVRCGRLARQLDAAIQVDSLAELKHLFALVPLLVAVTGRVLAPSPLKCEMSDAEAAIVELREEKQSEQRVSGGVWVRNSQLLREVVREAEWGLRDSSSKRELPVQDGHKAQGDFLQTTTDCLIPERRAPLAQIADEVIGSRIVGVRRLERALPTGTMLTAIGELSTAMDDPAAFKGAVRKGGMMLVLRPPRNGPFLLSRKPLPELIASLQTSSKAYQHWAVAFTMLGVSLLAAAGTQHALIWTRQQRMRRAAEKALRQRAAAGSGADVAAASDATADGEQDGGIARGLCVVCLERPCDTVFPACGHMCACSRCSGALPRCPICRSRAPAIRVYTT